MKNTEEQNEDQEVLGPEEALGAVTNPPLPLSLLLAECLLFPPHYSLGVFILCSVYLFSDTSADSQVWLSHGLDAP